MKYVNLDPNREERQRRGIPDFLDDAAQERVRSCATVEEQQAAYCDELRKLSLLREPLWLEKLLAFGQPWTSMLFVCGSGHIESFMAKLHAAGFSVEVVEPDWSRGHPCKPGGC